MTSLPVAARVTLTLGAPAADASCGETNAAAGTNATARTADRKYDRTLREQLMMGLHPCIQLRCLDYILQANNKRVADTANHVG